MSSAWDKRPRRLHAHICERCSGRFFAPGHLQSRFCSTPCAREAQKQRSLYTCGHCQCSFERAVGRTRYSRSGLQFCSRLCKDTAQRLGGCKEIQPPHYGSAKWNKAQLIRSRGHKCEVCQESQWCGQAIALEVHHVDGNAANNDPENLKLLCPNCHAQTSTYRGRNMGHGRKSRGIRKVTGS